VLAGDHAKSASDLGIGLVGREFVLSRGLFPADDQPGQLAERYYTLLNPKNLPLEPVLDAKGEPLVGTVGIAMSEVISRSGASTSDVCRCICWTPTARKNEPHYRDLTLRGVRW